MRGLDVCNVTLCGPMMKLFEFVGFVWADEDQVLHLAGLFRIHHTDDILHRSEEEFGDVSLSFGDGWFHDGAFEVLRDEQVDGHCRQVNEPGCCCRFKRLECWSE